MAGKQERQEVSSRQGRHESVVASALLGLACAAHAQSTVKCQDQNGRIVYVDRDCAVYGLREIGPV
ncbi:MAG: DUF4124 domain-containing protein, partial [Betaproteobacteria bacterium]